MKITLPNSEIAQKLPPTTVSYRSTLPATTNCRWRLFKAVQSLFRSV